MIHKTNIFCGIIERLGYRQVFLSVDERIFLLKPMEFSFSNFIYWLMNQLLDVRF